MVRFAMVSMLAALPTFVMWASPQVFSTVVEPLDGEKWWGGVVNDGDEMPYGSTKTPVNLAWYNHGGATAPFLLSSAGRYVWSDRPFTYAFTNDVLYLSSETECVEPVAAGKTLRDAYRAACARHFPFDGRTPATLLSRCRSGTTGSRLPSRA